MACRSSLYQGAEHTKETDCDFKGANMSRPDERTEFSIETLSSRSSDRETQLKEESIN